MFTGAPAQSIQAYRPCDLSCRNPTTLEKSVLFFHICSQKDETCRQCGAWSLRLRCVNLSRLSAGFSMGFSCSREHFETPQSYTRVCDICSLATRLDFENPADSLCVLCLISVIPDHLRPSRDGFVSIKSSRCVIGLSLLQVPGRKFLPKSDPFSIMFSALKIPHTCNISASALLKT